jgi:hypothetical protein
VWFIGSLDSHLSIYIYIYICLFGFVSFSFLCSLLINVFRFHIAPLYGGGSLASRYRIVWVVFMCVVRVSLVLKTPKFA